MSFVNRAVEAGELGRGEVGRRLASAAELASEVRTIDLELLDDRGGNSHPGVEFSEGVVVDRVELYVFVAAALAGVDVGYSQQVEVLALGGAESVVALGEVGGAGDASPAGADYPAGPAAFGSERSAPNAGEKDQQRQVAAARTLSADFRRRYGRKAIAVSTVGNAHDDWSRFRLSASRAGLPSLVYPREQVWER